VRNDFRSFSAIVLLEPAFAPSEEDLTEAGIISKRAAARYSAGLKIAYAKLSAQPARNTVQKVTIRRRLELFARNSGGAGEGSPRAYWCLSGQATSFAMST
jgi:hypothetical protein